MLPQGLKRAVTEVRIALHWLARLGLVLFFCVFGLLLYLQTPAGLQTLGDLVAHLISGPQARITIGKTRGVPPRSLSFEGITIADSKGVWARVGKVDLVLNPLALFQGTIAVEALRFQHAEVLRQPEPSPMDNKPFRLPDLPVAISLEAFAVQELKLDKAVAGVQADMAIIGRGHWKGRELVLDADIKRTDAATDRIKLSFNLAQDIGAVRPRLEVLLNLRGDPGGVFAGLVQLKPGKGITGSLKGQGPLDGWNGDLVLKAEGLGALEGLIKIRERPLDVAVGFVGSADLGLVMPKDMATRMGATVALDTEAFVARGRSVGYRLKVSNSALDVTAASPGDPSSKTRIWTVAAKILKPAAIAPWIKPATFKTAEATAVVEGSFTQPRIKFDALINGFSMPQGSIAHAKATGDLKLAKTGAGWSGSGGATGRLSGLTVAKGDSSAGLSLDKIDFSIVSALDGANHNLTISKLDLRGGSVTAAGSGHISLKGGDTALTLQVKAGDLKLFERLAGLPIKGAAVIDLMLARKTSTSALQISAKASGHDLDLGNDVANALLGPKVEASFEGTQGAGQGFLGKAAIRGGVIAGELNGRYAQAALDNTKFHIEVIDVNALSALTGMPLPPKISLDGTARGKLADLSVEGSLTSADLIRRRLKLTAIRGKFAFQNLGNAPHGNANFDMSLPAGALHAAASLSTPKKGVMRLDAITVTAPETAIKGSLTLARDKPVEGVFTGKSTNLKILARQFNLEASGSADLSLMLKNQGGRQRIEMSANGSKIASVLPNRDVIRMDKLTFTASAFRNKGLQDLDLDLAVSGIRAATAEITSLTLKAKGKGAAAHYALALQGNFRGRVSVASVGDFIDRADGFNLTVNSFDGTVYDRPLKLNQPLYVKTKPGELTAAPLDLTFGKGHLAGSWVQGPQGEAIEGAAKNIDLILLSLLYPEAPVKGEGDATVSLRVVQGLPLGEITVALRDVVPVLARGKTIIPAAAANLVAKIGGKTVVIKGRITAPNTLDVTVAGNLPLLVDQKRQTVTLALDQPIQGQIDWKGEMATLWNMMPPSDHRISGNLEGRLAVKGTLADPGFYGDLAIRDGAYDSLSLGLVARQLKASLALSGRRVTVVSSEASDASGGTFKAKGWIDLRPDQHFPALLDLTLDKARIMRTSDLKAAASAVVAYSRAADHAALNGNAEVRQIDAKLIRRLPPEVPDIEVKEINLPPDAAVGVTTRIIGGKSKIIYPTQLNVHVKAPRRVFVRGRGLDSEWKGDLDVEGTVQKPVISGEMSIVSGTFTLGGKDFTLTEGTLNFTTGEKIDPLINLRAEYKMTDITAILMLTGRASAPLIKLTSTPELPQEEVMSRILFGTSVAQLGPLEAVQLGSAVAGMTGSGGGLDLMNIARTTLGLDRLRFQSSTDRSAGTLIAGGKYLTNNIYVEVETATGTGQSKARVKVNLTEHIIVESDVGSANSSSLGLKWEKDY